MGIIMRLTVNLKIIAGYIAVLVLSLGLLFTGLWGIGTINSGLHRVTEEALPRQSKAGSMALNLLQSKAMLIAYQKEQSANGLDESEAAYNAYVASAVDARDQLLQLTQNNPSLYGLVEESNQLTQGMFTVAQELLLVHREEVRLHHQVNGQLSEFSDMVDESLSYISDLEGKVEDYYRSDVSDLITELDNIGSLVTGIKKQAIAPAVFGASKRAMSKFKKMDARLQEIEFIPGVAGSDEYKNFMASYKRFKVASTGEEGVFKSYIEQLKKNKESKKTLADFNKDAELVLLKVEEIQNEVDVYSNKIKQSALNTVSQSRLLLMVFGLVALMASIIIGFLVSRSVRLPLASIVAVVKEVATGDLTQSCDEHNRDEFGELATDINILIHNLSNIIAQIDDNSNRLAATAERTSEASRNNFDNINDQREQTQMIATAVEEMSATVDEVANSSSSTLEEVNNASKEVYHGEKVLNENIESIQKLAVDIEASAEVINQLSEHSHNIGSVLDVISGISEQTNLLALNAAIEAARAGEQGRGFAVVADEVRTLASKTYESTSEIQEMIQKLQVGVRAAVDTMETSRTEANDRVESIAVAGEVLASISASMTRINDMSQQIATAAEEQSYTTQEQNRNINAIAESAENAATCAQENMSASVELSEMAGSLQKILQQFKV